MRDQGRFPAALPASLPGFFKSEFQGIFSRTYQASFIRQVFFVVGYHGYKVLLRRFRSTLNWVATAFCFDSDLNFNRVLS